MNKVSVLSNVAILSSLLLSSASYAADPRETGMPEEEKLVLTAKAPTSQMTVTPPPSQNQIVKRNVVNGGWKKLTPDEKEKLIPGKNDSFTAAPVTNALHGRQFKHLGQTEKDFTQLCATLPGGTVVVWGDGWGRVSIDAFRRNGSLRVIYNELDPKNMGPFQKFQKLCVLPQDQNDLVALAGNCLTVPTSTAFQNLFPNQDPRGQLAATFGANFLHFMTPSEVVEYFALQYDLLAQGGQTFGIFHNDNEIPEVKMFASKIDREGIEEALSLASSCFFFLSTAKSAISSEAVKLLKKEGILFSGYMNGEWVARNQKTDPQYNDLFKRLFAKHAAVNHLCRSAIASIIKAIGFEVVQERGLDLTNMGVVHYDPTNSQGAWTGIVLRKPKDAPAFSDPKYFRNSVGFKELVEQAKKEELLIQEFYQNVSFKPTYPFFEGSKNQKMINIMTDRNDDDQINLKEDQN